MSAQYLPAEGVKRARGRPLAGSTPILVRVPPGLLHRIDAWRRMRTSEPCRAAAMRQIVEMFLEGVERAANGE